MESDAIYFYCHNELRHVALAHDALLDRDLLLDGLVTPVIHVLIGE
jgi:hypothetical protein